MPAVELANICSMKYHSDGNITKFGCTPKYAVIF